MMPVRVSRRCHAAVVLILLAFAFLRPALARAQSGAVIDSMDQADFTAQKEKARVEAVPGHDGGALKFTFAEDAKGVFVQGHVRGNPAWDSADGFSFWVKGDGSDHLGGLEFVWNEDYSIRYAYAFPIDRTEWRKITVRWSDLTPESSGIAKMVDPVAGNAPSKLGPITFGKWWYWKDYAAHSYAIDDIRLETHIPAEPPAPRPAGAPLGHVLAKLRAGKPITIVTMGDSLTDLAHWSNQQNSWPGDLKAAIMQKFGSAVTLINPALGGTELRQNLILIPHWVQTISEPDLVTIFFGYNDWNAGMRGPGFLAAQREAVERIRRATGGHADVLILTTYLPSTDGGPIGELATACRQAAQAEDAGICDIYAAFSAVPVDRRAALYASDGVHLGRAGQQLVAKSVLEAIERGGR